MTLQQNFALAISLLSEVGVQLLACTLHQLNILQWDVLSWI